MYGFLLAIWSRDLPILKYLFEDCASHVQLHDQDLIRLFKHCIGAGNAQALLFLMHSLVTAQIFSNAGLAAKEELIAYVLSDTCIESECINSNKSEETVRELKEVLSQYPYCAITWLYLDYTKDSN